MPITSPNVADYPSKPQETLLSELLSALALTPVVPNLYKGESFDFVGPRIFGGQVLAQALLSAAYTLEFDKPCHSLHGYFLRGGDIRRPVYYQVRRLRDGKSLSAREVVAVQYDDKGVESVIFSMIASFAVPEEGLDYQPNTPSYPQPDELPDEQTLKASILPNVPEHLRERYMRQRHIDIRPITPRDPTSRTPSASKQAHWLKIHQLGDQPAAIHQALLAFVSDYYLATTAMLAHGISLMTEGLQLASIDHSMHFHRPFDMRDWLLYDLWSDTSSSAKGLNHGQFWQDGKLIATTQQENLMRLLSKHEGATSA